MSEAVYYRCWTVTCKAEGCGCLLFLDIIGRYDPVRFSVLPPFASFKITCPQCETEHRYGPLDVEERNLEDPPKDYRCREFLEAIRRASGPSPSGSDEAP